MFEVLQDLRVDLVCNHLYVSIDGYPTQLRLETAAEEDSAFPLPEPMFSEELALSWPMTNCDEVLKAQRLWPILHILHIVHCEAFEVPMKSQTEMRKACPLEKSLDLDADRFDHNEEALSAVILWNTSLFHMPIRG